MAVEVIGWVFNHSRSRNGQRLVMLAVADACNSPDGTGAWLSNAALQAKTGLSERAVRVAVRECEELGELKVEIGRGRGGVNRFMVVMTVTPAAPAGTRNPAESAPLSETRQNLPPAESAPHRTGEAPQVRARKPADSAGEAGTGNPAESAPGTVKNSSTKSSVSPKKRPRSQPKVEAYREDVERICSHLAEKIESLDIDRPEITNAWRREARLLLDQKRKIPVDVARVIAAIDWVSSHRFWHRNILSMPTLREKWDRLLLERQAELKQAEQRSGGSNHVYRNKTDQDAYEWKAPRR